jgi:hypothetical protein
MPREPPASEFLKSLHDPQAMFQVGLTLNQHRRKRLHESKDYGLVRDTMAWWLENKAEVRTALAALSSTLVSWNTTLGL